jgi:signal transduction histidine kinase
LNGPRRLWARLLGTQLLLHVLSVLVVWTFAPRLLLLSPAMVSASSTLAWIWGVTHALLLAVASFAVVSPLQRTLAELDSPTGAPLGPATVLSIAAVPTRLVALQAASGLFIGLLILLPPLRPAVSDFSTQLALSVLSMTMSSAALLAAYVMMRGAVAKVLELVPPKVAKEATDLLSRHRRLQGRLRARWVAAVAAPVAFVATGSLLLVYAHGRTADALAQQEAATVVARATLAPLDNGDIRGRSEVLKEAAALGYRIVLDPTGKAPAVAYGDEGEVQLRVSLDMPEDEHVLVRFVGAQVPAIMFAYVFLAAIAAALAALLGLALGRAVQRDLTVATEEVRRTGVSAIVSGGRVLGSARFRSVEELVQAIDALGRIFRDFAAAQSQAIMAREATERMRALFLASMSHDLRGPLNAILGFAELVGRSHLTTGQRESLQIIAQRGRELLTLIQTILDSARVEAGELDFSPDWTSTGDVVMSAVLDVRDMLGDAGQVTAQVQPDLPSIHADATRIVQALTAVVQTAMRLTDQGHVSVRASAPPYVDQVCIEIESSGGGLPSDERERLFEAFKTVELARRHGSLGLGLSLAKSLIEIHGGTIAVETSPSGATVFRIHLPVRADKGEMQQRLASRPQLGD